MQVYRYPIIISVSRRQGEVFDAADVYDDYFDIEFVDFHGATEYGVAEENVEDVARKMLYEMICEYMEDNAKLPKPSTNPPRKLKKDEEFRVIQLIL